MFGWFTKSATDTFSQDVFPHVDSLYSTALRMTRNPSDAEDLLQESIMKAFRARKTFTPGSNRRAWLFKILTNTFINDFHKAKRERGTFDRSYDFSEIEGRYVDQWASSEYHGGLSFSEQMSDEVKHAFESLPPQFKMVVELVDLQDFGYAEAAEILNCPIGTIMSRLARGRKLLQNALHDYALKEGVIKEKPEENLQEASVHQLSARQKG